MSRGAIGDDAACEPNPILKLLSAIVRMKRLGGGSTVATDPPAAPISSHRTSSAWKRSDDEGLSERVKGLSCQVSFASRSAQCAVTADPTRDTAGASGCSHWLDC